MLCVVTVDVNCVSPCNNIIRFDRFRIIRLVMKVKDVEGRYSSIN